MTEKIIVYDFDKTLTYKDTLFGFFYASIKNPLLDFPKLTIYIGSMVLAKFKVISNSLLKEIGVELFLKGKSSHDITLLSQKYARLIPFNNLYETLHVDSQNDYFIISASFEEYLYPLFSKDVHIIGSVLSYDGDKVSGLKFNCYKEKKVLALKQRGIEEIDLLYTDSYSDLALAKISKKIVIVDGDKLIEVGNIDEFKRYFKR